MTDPDSNAQKTTLRLLLIGRGGGVEGVCGRYISFNTGKLFTRRARSLARKKKEAFHESPKKTRRDHRAPGHRQPAGAALAIYECTDV